MTSFLNRHRRKLHIVGALTALLTTATIIYLDFKTGLWKETVILSGIAAGLLTFILTAIYINKVMERAAKTQWLPVTHLALTDISHALADESKSEIANGKLVPRTFDHSDTSDNILNQVMAERKLLTEAISRWAGFLSESADVKELMNHLAATSFHLDQIRDAALVSKEDGDRTQLQIEVTRYNHLAHTVSAELLRVIKAARNGKQADAEQAI